jgi:hypothetical protein
MWLKCGAKIPNEINEVNNCVFFFGSVIYQFSSVLRGDLLSQHPSPKWDADLRLCS